MTMSAKDIMIKSFDFAEGYDAFEVQSNERM